MKLQETANDYVKQYITIINTEPISFFYVFRLLDIFDVSDDCERLFNFIQNKRHLFFDAEKKTYALPTRWRERMTMEEDEKEDDDFVEADSVFGDACFMYKDFVFDRNNIKKCYDLTSGLNVSSMIQVAKTNVRYGVYCTSPCGKYIVGLEYDYENALRYAVKVTGVINNKLFVTCYNQHPTSDETFSDLVEWMSKGIKFELTKIVISVSPINLTEDPRYRAVAICLQDSLIVLSIGKTSFTRLVIPLCGGRWRQCNNIPIHMPICKGWPSDQVVVYESKIWLAAWNISKLCLVDEIPNQTMVSELPTLGVKNGPKMLCNVRVLNEEESILVGMNDVKTDENEWELQFRRLICNNGVLEYSNEKPVMIYKRKGNLDGVSIYHRKSMCLFQF